jgi:hypothetical protein
MLVLHRGSRVVSFLPQVSTKKAQFPLKYPLLPSNPAILSPPGCQRCVSRLVRPGQEGFADIKLAGPILAFASRFSRFFCACSNQTTSRKYFFPVEFFDLTFAFETAAGTVTNVRPAR